MNSLGCPLSKCSSYNPLPFSFAGPRSDNWVGCTAGVACQAQLNSVFSAAPAPVVTAVDVYNLGLGSVFFIRYNSTDCSSAINPMSDPGYFSFSQVTSDSPPKATFIWSPNSMASVRPPVSSYIMCYCRSWASNACTPGFYVTQIGALDVMGR